MGGSEKADDPTKLGTFCSGLKFSMALAKRYGVDLSVSVYDSVFSDNFDRKRTTLYTTYTYTESCEQTGKEKELIKITQSVSCENFHSGHTCDYGGGDYPDLEILTGYSVKMGIDWKLYMLLREIYSNMLDEGGYYCETLDKKPEFGTVVTLEFDEDNEFYEIWQNKHLYINEETPLFKISDSVEVLENRENFLRIYKQNILVYEDRGKPSRYAYGIKFGQIDERRILSSLYSVEQDISYAIQTTDNEEFLKTIIKPVFEVEEKEFLSNNTHYSNHISDTVNKIVTEIYEEFGEVNSYDWLINKVRKRKDCKIGGKKIKTIEDSLWNYSTEVTVETTPQPYAEPTMTVDEVEYITPFASEIKQYYNFELDVEVKIAKLKGSKCVADLYEKCLIIDENFDIEKDFHTFVVVYLELTQKGNVVENLSRYICNLIRK